MLQQRGTQAVHVKCMQWIRHLAARQLFTPYRVVLRRAPAADWLSIFLIEGNPFHLEIQTRPQSRTLLDVRTGGENVGQLGMAGMTTSP